MTFSPEVRGVQGPVRNLPGIVLTGFNTTATNALAAHEVSSDLARGMTGEPEESRGLGASLRAGDEGLDLLGH